MKMEMPSIRDLKPGTKNLTMVLIVLEIGKPSTTKDGHEVRSIRVADKSASMNLSLWGEPGTLLQPGDIIRISKAYCSLFKSHLTLYIGKGGDLQRLGDFCFVFSESPNVSEEPFHTPVSNQSGGTGSPSAGPASNSTGSSGANAQVRPPLPSHPRKSGNLAK